MKKAGKYLIIYALLLTVYTLAFRFLLSHSLTKEYFTMAWIYAGIYGIFIFFTAWTLGKAFSLRKIFFDAGIWFHLITYVVCNAIGELWFIFELNSPREHIFIIHLTALIWGLGLAFHFLFFLLTKKQTLRGIQKSEVFD